jgi:phage recombination protein Bet
MNGEVQVIETVTRDKVVHFLQTFGLANQLNKQETEQFCEIAQAYNLNPFKREVYCLPYGQGDRRKLSIVTGYEVYLKRAERLGLLDGWSAKIVGNDKSFSAIVEIYRKDWSKPFVHEVYYEEVVQLTREGRPNAMWTKMPRFMTKKVATAQAFRMAFPDEFGGMPYTSDELPDEMTKPQTEYIPPKQDARTETAAEARNIPDNPEPETGKNSEYGVLAIGEQIPNWFWSMTKEERAKHMPDNGTMRKVDGKWLVVEKEAS